MFMPVFEFYEVKKKKKKKNVIIFQKENGSTFTLFIIFIVKSLQKEQNSTNLLLWLGSAGINLQLPQSDSTPWTLTLACSLASKSWLFLYLWNSLKSIFYEPSKVNLQLKFKLKSMKKSVEFVWFLHFLSIVTTAFSYQ